MSFATGLSGMLGLNNDFSPEQAPIVNPTNAQQVQGAYDGSQNALAQQQAFLQALQGQGGVGNQAAVFNQMQGLNTTLQNQANGTGANPAMAQLQQTTAQNVANQNAMMAGQRNAGSNAGLMARQAAQQGAATQQQAVGQGATMAANQQIAAQGQLMQNNANMGNMANQQVAQQANATTGINQMQQNQQQMLINAQQGYNNTLQSGVNQNNTLNAGISASNQKTGNGIISGALGSIGSAMGMFAHGGMVQPQKFADGGVVGPASAFAQFAATQAAGSQAPGMVAVDPASLDSGGLDKGKMQGGSDAMSSMMGMFGGGGAGGGTMVAGGAMDAGGLSAMAPMVMMASKGAVVPGKAAVAGDSLKNDNVPAMLSPGEVVIPRHVMNSKNPAEAAKKFVAAIMAKQGKGA